MQVLYLWDTTGQFDWAAAEQVVRDQTDDMKAAQTALKVAQEAWENRQFSDQWVERLAPQWPPRRQPVIDRNILRLGVWELMNRPTPPKVVIDEVIELAKHFSTDQSASFINGVIDAVLREHQALVTMAPSVSSAALAGGASSTQQEAEPAAPDESVQDGLHQSAEAGPELSADQVGKGE